MHFRVRASISLLLFAAIGCSNTSPTPTVSNTTTTSPAESFEPQIVADIASWKEVNEWVAAQSGKIVVIDVWSTS